MLSISGGPNDVTVRQLRARVSLEDFDPLSTRLHLARLLAPFEPTIPWLAPSAILCIRSLPDPCPGTLQLRAQELRPPRAWERGLLAAIEEKVRRAVRPSLAFVPTDAESVVFADRSELLACLALDLASGLAAARWWWATLFRDVELANAFVSSLERQPEYIPPVFERLTRVRRLEQVFQILPERAGPALLGAVRERFALRTGSSSRSTSPPLPPAEEPNAGLAAVPSRSDLLVAFRAWISEPEVERLAPEARALVVIALLLRRAPFVLRSAGIADALVALGREVLAPPNVGSARSRFESPEAAAVTELETDSRPVEDEKKMPEEPAPRAVEAALGGWFDEAASAPRPASSPSGVSELPPVRLEEATAYAPTRSSLWGHAEPASGPCVVALAPSSEHPAFAPLGPPTRSSAVSELQRIYGAPTTTKLGGVFYLVNVALALDLYPDFTQPSSAGLDLSIWDFIALLAQGLLGECGPDPLWDLLATLAGRETGSVRLNDVKAPARRLPSGWGLPESSVPASGEADSFEGWLEWLLPRVRYRLGRALGLSPEDDLGQVLLRHAARVHVSDSHVDVRLSLAELPLPVRAAGLDRDPGFLPTAGRFLAFHFG